MRFKSFSVFVAALLLSLSALTASAQTTQATGKVVVRQADGTTVPAQGATVTFYRTDISGKYEVKTNSKGEYTRLGMPLGGTYTVVVSAPNAQPTFQQGVRLSGQETNFTLSPGDGRVLTLDEVKAAAAAPAAGGNAAAAANSEEARKRAEEIARERAETEAKNARAQSFNAKVPQINKYISDAGKALEAKKYDEAIATYDQAIAFEPSIGIFHRGKATALRGRGVDKYNTGIRSKDKAVQQSARADLKAAVDSSEQSVKAYQQAVNEEGLSPAEKQKAQADLLVAEADRAETYRLAMRVGMTELAEPASKAMQEYFNAETDPAKKAKFEVVLADALRDSGQVDQSVAMYRRMIAANPNNMEAVFGLGMALQYDADKLAQNAPEIITLMKQVLAKDTAADRKQAATDSIASMENLMQQQEAPAGGGTSKPRTTRRRGQ